ncbi:hypothetical protein SNEBB_001376 [Seison nebaliae]|nr:hypothetical protein SNEBB_001376 [Seison nebaliae]
MPIDEHRHRRKMYHSMKETSSANATPTKMKGKRPSKNKLHELKQPFISKVNNAVNVLKYSLPSPLVISVRNFGKQNAIWLLGKMYHYKTNDNYNIAFRSFIYDFQCILWFTYRSNTIRMTKNSSIASLSMINERNNNNLISTSHNCNRSSSVKSSLTPPTNNTIPERSATTRIVSPIRPVNLPMIHPSDRRIYTTDSGWGCMLRSAQMLLAQAIKIHLKCTQNEDDLRRVLRLFSDVRDTAPFGIYQLTNVSFKFQNISCGKWHSTLSAAKCLSHALDATALLPNFFISVHDSRIHLADIPFDKWESHKNSTLLILVSTRLGIECINECYHTSIQSILADSRSVGILGGRPRHSLYFVGFQKQKLIYLDPHICQTSVDMTKKSFPLHSYRTTNARKIPFSSINPSLCFGFVFNSGNSNKQSVIDRLHSFSTDRARFHTEKTENVSQENKFNFNDNSSIISCSSTTTSSEENVSGIHTTSSSPSSGSVCSMITPNDNISLHSSPTLMKLVSSAANILSLTKSNKSKNLDVPESSGMFRLSENNIAAASEIVSTNLPKHSRTMEVGINTKCEDLNNTSFEICDDLTEKCQIKRSPSLESNIFLNPSSLDEIQHDDSPVIVKAPLSIIESYKLFEITKSSRLSEEKEWNESTKNLQMNFHQFPMSEKKKGRKSQHKKYSKGNLKKPRRLISRLSIQRHSQLFTSSSSLTTSNDGVVIEPHLHHAKKYRYDFKKAQKKTFKNKSTKLATKLFHIKYTNSSDNNAHHENRLKTSSQQKQSLKLMRRSKSNYSSFSSISQNEINEQKHNRKRINHRKKLSKEPDQYDEAYVVL